MSFAEKFILAAQRILPSPFTIAVILTLITFLFAFIFTEQEGSTVDHIITLGVYWQNGFWGFLTFAMQMMLILVLGHSLALTKPIQKIIDSVLPFCSSTARAALMVTFLALVVAYINWGLGLIFGAIMARRVGEYSRLNNIDINYPLIGAAGYAGMMVWHGGLSASAPLKVAEEGHNLVEQIGVIPAAETLGSFLNIGVIAATLIILPLSMYLIGSKLSAGTRKLPKIYKENKPLEVKIFGAEKLDHSKLLAIGLGGIMLLLSIRSIWTTPDKASLSFLTLNFINFFLFGLGLMLHGSVYKYLKAVGVAITGSAGILIQFPIYAGIMGIMSDSGLITLFSKQLAAMSNQFTFPLFTFFSAAIVNVFVPSGGGQWIIQGPIIVESAKEVGVPIGKSIMAMAYGDQLTNMLQPFWALPLLGITGLKAKEILPYTFALFVIGLIIFSLCLILF